MQGQQQENPKAWFQVLQTVYGEAYDRKMVKCASKSTLNKAAKDLLTQDSWKSWMRIRAASRQETVEECQEKVQRKLAKLQQEEGACYELAQLSGACTQMGGEYFMKQQGLECGQVMQAFAGCLCKGVADLDPEPSRNYRRAVQATHKEERSGRGRDEDDYEDD
jgi:hypothetical protein